MIDENESNIFLTFEDMKPLIPNLDFEHVNISINNLISILHLRGSMSDSNGQYLTKPTWGKKKTKLHTAQMEQG